jgi:hypothetical protein
MNQLNEMMARIMRINDQLNQANGVLQLVAREREADAYVYRRLADERQETINHMAATIQYLEDINDRLARSYETIADELE